MKIYEILVCPCCGNNLILVNSEDIFVCKACLLSFPIENDIPIMLIEKSKKLSLDDVRQYE